MWRVNGGDYPHNVNIDEGLLDSRNVVPGRLLLGHLRGAGDGHYHCSPQITGSVTVA